MTLVVNTDVHRRTWPSLARAEAVTVTETVLVPVTAGDLVGAVRVDQVAVVDAGSTLELDPGEPADVVLPDGFEDPYLKPVD